MASGGDKKTGKQWGTILIALLAALLVLLLAGWLDAFLLDQKKIAAASFEYTPMFWAQIGARLILVAAWSGLAWLVLYKLNLSRMGGLIFLVVGLFVLLSTYLGLLVGLPVVRLRLDNLETGYLNCTGAFIAVLGMVVLKEPYWQSSLDWRRRPV